MAGLFAALREAAPEDLADQRLVPLLPKERLHSVWTIRVAPRVQRKPGQLQGQTAITFLKHILVCVVTCSSAGCGTYWKDRARDLVDPFGLGFDGGHIYGANVRATQFVQVGAAVVTVTERRVFRFVGRNDFRRLSSLEAGLAPFYYHRSTTADDGAQGRDIVLCQTHIRGVPKVLLAYIPEKDDYEVTRLQTEFWSYVPDRKAYERNYDRRLFDFGFSVYAILGVDVEFNPFELVDFLLGFGGIDIAGDDSLELKGEGSEKPDEPPPREPRPGGYNATALVRLCAADELEIREAAGQELKRLGDVAVPALAAGLKHENVHVRRMCVDVLWYLIPAGRLKDQRLLDVVVPALVEGLNDGDPDVRCWCVYVLDASGAVTEAAVEALKDVRDHDPEPWVRNVARYALERIGAE